MVHVCANDDAQPVILIANVIGSPSSAVVETLEKI